MDAITACSSQPGRDRIMPIPIPQGKYIKNFLYDICKGGHLLVNMYASSCPNSGKFLIMLWKHHIISVGLVFFLSVSTVLQMLRVLFRETVTKNAL